MTKMLLVAGVVILAVIFFRPNTPEEIEAEIKAEAVRAKSESELIRTCVNLHSDLSGFLTKSRKIMPYPDDTYGNDVFIVVLNGKISGMLDYRNCAISKNGTIIDHNG